MNPITDTPSQTPTHAPVRAWIYLAVAVACALGTLTACQTDTESVIATPVTATTTADAAAPANADADAPTEAASVAPTPAPTSEPTPVPTTPAEPTTPAATSETSDEPADSGRAQGRAAQVVAASGLASFPLDIEGTHRPVIRFEAPVPIDRFEVRVADLDAGHTRWLKGFDAADAGPHQFVLGGGAQVDNAGFGFHATAPVEVIVVAYHDDVAVAASEPTRHQP